MSGFLSRRLLGPREIHTNYAVAVIGTGRPCKNIVAWINYEISGLHAGLGRPLRAYPLRIPGLAGVLAR